MSDNTVLKFESRELSSELSEENEPRVLPQKRDGRDLEALMKHLRCPEGLKAAIAHRIAALRQT